MMNSNSQPQATSNKKAVAVVTGGSRGIGAGVCRRLAADGFHVVVNYSNNESRAREVSDAILKSSGSAEIAHFDVSDSAAVDAFFDGLNKRVGPTQVLVNNAGITVDSLLMRLKDEDLERTLNVDLKGAIFCTRAASRQMMRAKMGSVIHISSVIGEMGNGGQAAYAAAKAGLLGFSKSVAKELGSRNIRSNVITPGFIETEMTQALTEAQKEAILRGIPLASLGTVDDVAALVAFLASDQSRYITGQVIGINGGMYM